MAFKTVVVYNSRNDSGIAKVVDTIRDYMKNYSKNISLYDFKDRKLQHEHYFAIGKLNPDLIITIDMAGFEMRTETDKPSYNIMHCRLIHVLLHEREYYGEFADDRLTLSQFKVDMSNNSEILNDCDKWLLPVIREAELI